MVLFLKKTVLLLMITAFAALGLAAGQSVTHQVRFAALAQAAPGDGKTGEERYKNIELFQRVLNFIETNYVDEVTNDALVHGAIKGMMDTLDPHSNFLPPEVFKDMKIDTSGKFGGLGIEIGMKDGVLTVIAPIEDTPAWEQGLKPNDRIVKINGESTKGMSLVEAVAKMRGDTGSIVNLSIFRKGWEKVRDVPITRKEIKIKAAKHEILDEGYGYIRLKTFSESAASDMEDAIRKMEKRGRLRGLVFDMRNTPGGLLDQAIDVSSLFIDEGVIVSTVGRDPNQREVKHARKGKARKSFPVAILVNSSTASAAEIVAGALQDHNRAIVMGQPTFGKGSVQTVIDLGAEMGLKLTIARYYTPKGRSIQEKGVAPDILLDEFDSKLLAQARISRDTVREKDLKGHLKGDGGSSEGEYTVEELEELAQTDGASKSTNEVPEPMTPVRTSPKEDYQVQEALNYLKSYEYFKKIANTIDAEEKKPVAVKK